MVHWIDYNNYYNNKEIKSTKFVGFLYRSFNAVRTIFFQRSGISLDQSFGQYFEFSMVMHSSVLPAMYISKGKNFPSPFTYLHTKVAHTPSH